MGSEGLIVENAEEVFVGSRRVGEIVWKHQNDGPVDGIITGKYDGNISSLQHLNLVPAGTHDGAVSRCDGDATTMDCRKGQRGSHGSGINDEMAGYAVDGCLMCTSLPPCVASAVCRIRSTPRIR